MTDSVNVPREWLEEMAGYLGATNKNDWSELEPNDAMRGSHCVRVGALMELRAMLAAAPTMEQEPAGTAESEVGRAAYVRIEQLIALNPKPKTSEWTELNYLLCMTGSVEELGAFDGPSTPLVAPAPSRDELLEALVRKLKEYEWRIAGSVIEEALDLIARHKGPQS